MFSRTLLSVIFCYTLYFSLPVHGSGKTVGGYYEWKFSSKPTNTKNAEEGVHTGTENPVVKLADMEFIRPHVAITNAQNVFLKAGDIVELEDRPFLKHGSQIFAVERIFSSFSKPASTKTEDATNKHWEKTIKESEKYTKDSKPLAWICFKHKIPDAIQKKGTKIGASKENVEKSIKEMRKEFKYNFDQEKKEPTNAPPTSKASTGKKRKNANQRSDESTVKKVKTTDKQPAQHKKDEPKTDYETHLLENPTSPLTPKAFRDQHPIEDMYKKEKKENPFEKYKR